MVDWYNQRGEASENRIKELKTGLGMERMPSGNTKANAVFFRIGVLASNLFLLFRRLILDERFQRAQVQTVRWQVYQVAGKSSGMRGVSSSKWRLSDLFPDSSGAVLAALVPERESVRLLFPVPSSLNAAPTGWEGELASKTGGRIGKTPEMTPIFPVPDTDPDSVGNSSLQKRGLRPFSLLARSGLKINFGFWVGFWVV